MIRSIQLGPYHFFADDSSRPGLDILQNGFNYEMHVVAELRKWIPSARGFLDIGANCGIHSMIAKTIQPEIPVVCVEVSRYNLNLLLRNIVSNQVKNITVLPFAASDQSRIVRTNMHEPNMCVSLQGHPDSEDYPWLASALPLDLFKLPPIDLIKIDIEGFEINALNGAIGLIRQHRPRIIFEFCPEITHRSEVTPVEMLDWFINKGYRLTVLDYLPGMRRECSSAAEVMEHIANTSKWIADLLAEPVN